MARFRGEQRLFIRFLRAAFRFLLTAMQRQAAPAVRRGVLTSGLPLG